MSKSLEDYRNIVKILKLKLLTLREENTELTRSVGGIEQKTSNHGLIQRLQGQQGIIPHNKAALLTFCDKCETVGLTPQKLYRIADSKCMRKISTQTFKQTLTRVKLGLSQGKIQQLSNLFDLRREQSIYLEDFLSILSAYLVNTEKYPAESSRAYPQLALIKLSQASDLDTIRSKMFLEGETVNFEDFQKYARKAKWPLSETELVAVFLAMDSSEKFEVTKQGLVNCLLKVGKVIKEEGIVEESNPKKREKPQKPEKQVSIQKDPKSARKDSKVDPKKKPAEEQGRPPNIKKKDTKKLTKEQSQNEFDQDIDTGVQKANKMPDQKPTKQLSKQLQQAANVLRKLKLTPDNLITKLIETDQAAAAEAAPNSSTHLRSFTVYDLYRAAQSITKSPKKQQIQLIFKCIDLNGRGTISTCQLAKFWLKVRESKTLNQTFYKIIKRQLNIQKITEFEQYFRAFTGKQKDTITADLIFKAFKELRFDKSQVQEVFELMGKMTVPALVQKIKGDSQQSGKSKSVDKLDRNKTDVYDALIKKIKPSIKQEDYFEKLMRGQSKQQRWKTIFYDQWACWKFCYQTAKTLKSKWRDPQFGPNNQDKYGYASMLSNISDVPPGFLIQQDVQWTTFAEFAKRTGEGKQIFSDKVLYPSDVIQGGIGNCWLISAMSIYIQKNEHFTGPPLQEILKKKQLANNYTKGTHPFMFAGFRKYGIYVMKFFKNSKAVYVVVDELVPCQNGNIHPFCARSPNPGMQWAALLEKAYAKMHHAYSALISGDIAQGLADLTNCLPVKLILGEKQPKDEKLYQQLFNYQQTNQMIGCSISPPEGGGRFVQKPVKYNGQVSGLVYGHAYSITDILEIPNKMDGLETDEHRLIRVRNPWGQGQWQLDWSERPVDQNTKLQKHMEVIKAKYKERKKNREEIEDYDLKEDGTFMISFEDWSSVYSSLFLGLNLSDYAGVEAQDAWSEKYPSGVCSTKAQKSQRQKFAQRNIQYLLEVDSECEILLFIFQKDGRLYRGEKYPFKQICNPVALLVFKIDPKQSSLKIFDKKLLYDPKMKLQVRREVTFWKKFDKGRYIVIPATNSFDNGFQNKLTSFKIRMYSNGKPRISRVGEDRKFVSLDRKIEQPQTAGYIRELLQKIVEIGV